jgi:hypothetical protein
MQNGKQGNPTGNRTREVEGNVPQPTLVPLKMSLKVHDKRSAAQAPVGGDGRSIDDRIHDLQTACAVPVLSVAYSFGLGYGTIAERFNQDNSDLFHELVIEAQALQREDESQIFHYIAKGNLYEVQQELDRIECHIRAAVMREMLGQQYSEITEEIHRRIRTSAIYATDCAGANIVHCAYLLKNYHIGRYLVQRYRRLATLPYSGSVASLIDYLHSEKSFHGSQFCGSLNALRQKLNNLCERLSITDDTKLENRMLYTGENILHILVLHHNYEEARWLLEYYNDHRHSHPDCLPRLVSSYARGKFFDRSGSFYVGSNPLQFAVCSNSTAMFDLVYSFASAASVGAADEACTVAAEALPVGPDVIFSTDKFGNNALHLCVLHGLDRMYQHVYNTAVQVMRLKIHTLYARHCSHKISEAVSPTLKLDFEDLVDCQGFRRREKVLRLPSGPDALRGWIPTEARRKVDERLVLALNEDLHSPLTLAACIIDKKSDSPEQLDRKVRSTA